MIENEIFNEDCIDFMSRLETGGVDLVLTDIPYGEVNRNSNGLRDLDKGAADMMTFNLQCFLLEVYRIAESTVIIFCGKEQLSEIHKFFSDKQKKGKGTVRQLVWKKTNPSPMNGKNIYLSGIENAVWFKKRGGTFNTFCKNTVFEYPCGKNKIHPTEKNHDLIKELILDNSNEGDLVFDPCAGSGSHLLVAKKNGRRWLGCELNAEWYKIAKGRLE